MAPRRDVGRSGKAAARSDTLITIAVMARSVTSAHAVILAAGPAQRLLPLTEHRPKGMLLIGGKPLLQHAVEALKAHGVASVTIVVGAHAEKIQAFFKDGADFGVPIRYVHQPEPAGTLDAVRRALESLDGGTAWILPGHAFLTDRMLAPLARGEGNLLLLAPAAGTQVQEIPAVRGDRLISMQHGRPVVGSTRVSTNILRADPELAEALAGEALAGHRALGLALGACADGHEVRTAGLDGPWSAIVEPWDVLRLNERVLESLPREGARPRGPRISGAVHIGRNSHVAATATLVGPLTLGDGCSIGDYTVVGPYVSVRNSTVVGAHCEVRRSILNNNVVLDSHGVVRGSILDDGARIGPGFICQESSTPLGPLGCIVGRDAVLGPGVRVASGAVVGVEGHHPAGAVLEAAAPPGNDAPATEARPVVAKD